MSINEFITLAEDLAGVELQPLTHEQNDASYQFWTNVPYSLNHLDGDIVVALEKL